MKNKKEKSEKSVNETSKQKEQADKKLLKLEIIIGVFSTIIFLGAILAGSLINMPVWLRICLFTSGLILFIIGISYALKIEQTAGYYECAECGHRYVPAFKNVLWAQHIGRTRKLKCPKCGKKSWNKKVLTKD